MHTHTKSRNWLLLFFYTREYVYINDVERAQLSAYVLKPMLQNHLSMAKQSN